MADRIVVLRAGRVEQVDTPLNLYNRPANLFVAGFIGAPGMNLWPADGLGNGRLQMDNGPEMELQGLPVPGAGRLTLGLRPQHLRLADPGEARLTATVRLVEALGSESVMHGDLPGGAAVLAVLPGQPGLHRGDQIDLTFDPASVHLFGSDGLRI